MTKNTPNPSWSKLEQKLGFTFKDQRLLEAAFIHRSYLNENTAKGIMNSNERLEFLGDAVLELSVSKFLFATLPEEEEGELTALRASLVKTETLAHLAHKFQLGKYLKMSRGEKQSGGETNASLLANTTEALIGAIFLDQGMPAVETFLGRELFPRLKTIIKLGLHRDFKSTLQEKVQSQGQPTPQYSVASEEGPDHKKQFTVAVSVGDQKLGVGVGSSKQRAEQQAARNALKKLEDKSS